jgi:hypothetical protein
MYDEDRFQDAYGGLGDQALDLVEFAEFEIGASVFEDAWTPFSRTVEGT